MRLNRRTSKKCLLGLVTGSAFLLIFYKTITDHTGNGNEDNEPVIVVNSEVDTQEDDTLVQSLISSISPDFPNSTRSCNIPLYVDPWDLSVKEYFTKRDTLCPVTGHLLTYVDSSGRLRPNLTTSKVTCKYAFMRRQARDQVNIYSPMKELPVDGVQLTDENPFVTTSCFDKSGRKLYTNSHLRVPDFNISQTGHGSNNDQKPSVLILVLESLSRLSYYRFLTQTQEALARLGNVQILSGLTKVGRNSFPNSFALLTGIPMKDEDCRYIGFWDKKFRFLWDDFKESGYLTAMMEDMAQMGLFTYFSSGFERPPTDWFPTPFWINMYPPTKAKDWSDIWQNFKQYCHTSEGPKIGIFTRQLLEFHRKLTIKLNQTYFMYSFYSQSIHEDFDYYPFVDSSVAKLIDGLNGTLDNTLLILMGDHGTMHGKYAEESPLGHMEGSLPFFAIRVPDKLHQRYPHLRQYLDLNADHLLSWWDIREMILDVARGTFDKLDYKRSLLSPWRTLVPSSRTCKDAFIDDDWCVCNGLLGPFPMQEEYLYRKMSKVVKSLLNDKLEAISSGGDYYCNSGQISSVKFTKIRHILPKETSKNALKEQVFFRVQLSPNQFRTFVILIRERTQIKTKWSEWSLFATDWNALRRVYCFKK